jgi:alkylation response protein AidB-like acyl-CoA dehydrogenase
MSGAAGIAPFSEDQAESIRMVRDSAAGIADGVARARAHRFSLPGFSTDVWRQMGELGWIGLAVPEAAGGSGLGMAEMCALSEELGRALSPEPLISGALSAALLAQAGDTDLLPRLLAGEVVVLTAWQDRANTLMPCTTVDTPRRFIPMGAGATHFLLPVGDALHVVDAAGCDVTHEITHDGGHLSTLRSGAGQVVGPVTLAPALDSAALATAAYLLGGMEAAFALTLDYLKTRQQFGKIIGTFQALQHKAADTKLHIALSRAAMEQAAAALDAGVVGDEAAALVSRAKARVSESAMLVGQACVQLSGGIGYTDDYDVGLYLRKAMVLAPMFGGAALHRARFMALSPEREEV